MTHYFYYTNDGAVKSYSESQLADPGNLNEIALDITDDDLALIKENYILHIRDGAIEITTPQSVIDEENKELLKQRVLNAGSINDIKDIILDLLS